MSGRFYHRSKKDMIRLSMTTDTDVVWLNIIMIRLSTVFGSIYHRSKKDVIRLSITTDTDVDCLNIITIRLSIVFGDCMQSSEVKSNVF